MGKSALRLRSVQVLCHKFNGGCAEDTQRVPAGTAEKRGHFKHKGLQERATLTVLNSAFQRSLAEGGK